MNKLTYNKPAKDWCNALPVGNGITGVMVYGGKTSETLCFNDCTLWSGYPKDQNNPESLKNLDKVRGLIFEGKNHEAQKLAEEKLCGFYSEAFMPLATVEMKIKTKSRDKYNRTLDLSKGIHTVTANSIKRDCFASYPDRVVCYHMESDKPFSVTASVKSALNSSVSTDNKLIITGNAPDYAAPNYVSNDRNPIRYDEGKGMAFALCAGADTNGELSFSDNKMTVKDATSLTLYFTTATGFKGYDQMPETSREAVLEKCSAMLPKKEYSQILEAHLEDYKSVFYSSNVSFEGDSDKNTKGLLADARKNGVSPALAELFYNFGKYMIVSGSRRGGQPLNLQGLWNDNIRPPWSSNYTVNINTEMNYWGVSRANLLDSAEPLLEMVWEIVQNGRKTAQINYGCGGFACNHNVDLWRKTSPVQGDCCYMLEPLCGIWLANEVLSHYKNGAYRDSVDKVVEVAREAAQFCADYLVMHDGKYVICPSPSAENSFMHNGKRCSLDYASAFNMGLVKQAFNNYLELDMNDELTEKINSIIPDLKDFAYGRNGILEYHEDYDMPERGHRHFSPLYAFYPANVIKYYENSEQTEQVRKLFYDRINHTRQHIGWSAAWGICLAARLHDSANVEMIMNRFLCKSVFKNLFSVHPPKLFQIDGNLGYVAGVHEFLVYEENGVIELLPALPNNLKNGKAQNLLVNGVKISFEWKNGEVVSVTADKPIRIMNKHLSDNVELNSNVTA